MTHRTLLISWLRKGLFLSAILFFGLFNACKEDGTVVPTFNSSNLNFGDTILDVTSITVRGDSILTSGTSRNLLGKLNDAIYGLTEANFYSEFYLSTSSLNIPSDVNFDSVVLFMAYDNFYGYQAQQTVNVYELSERLTEDEYRNSSTAPYETELLGTQNLSITSSDTFGDSTYVLRIRLADELATRLKEKENFADQNEWLDFFKGLHVTTDPAEIPSDAGEGAIVYFDMLSTRTKISFFYQDDGSTTSLDFPVFTESKRFSHFENTYSSNLEALLDKEGEPYNYIFANAGSRTEIGFVGLDKLLAQAPIIINKAELIIPYEDPIPDNYDPPNRNVIILKEDDGTFVLPPDYFIGGNDFFGGSLDEVNKEYRFNLASTMHDIINNGNSDRKLYLTISGAAVSANRLTLNSGQHPDRKIFLILTYTKSSN